MASQSKKQRLAAETFLLEPILTPSAMNAFILSTANDGIVAMSSIFVFVSKVAGVASQAWTDNPQLDCR